MLYRIFFSFEVLVVARIIFGTISACMALHNVIRDDALEDLDFESDVQDEVLIQLKLINMTWIWVHWVVLSLPLGFRYLVLSIMQCT